MNQVNLFLRRQQLRSGFSLIELIVVIAIIAIIVAGITTLTGRTFQISRSQVEQGRITEEAQVEVDRMVELIRGARNLDCDGNGMPDQAGEFWLQTAEANRLTLHANTDDDEAAERVVYAVVDHTLERRVDEPSGAPCTFTEGIPETLSTNVHNATTPVFAYVATDGSTLASPIPLDEVVRILIDLSIDVSEQQDPDAIHVVTEVRPRLALISEATPSATPLPAPIALRLFPRGFPWKPSPVQTTSGPVYIDVNEHWYVGVEYFDGTSWNPISGSDPDLSFLSANTAIVTIPNTIPMSTGQLFGKQAGRASVTATYRGTSLTFQVHVREGCWGNTAGTWVPVTTFNSGRLSATCRAAGYSGRAVCGRVCQYPKIPEQPGSHSHFDNLPIGGNDDYFVHGCAYSSSQGVTYDSLFCMP